MTRVLETHRDDPHYYAEAQLAFERTVRKLAQHTNKTMEAKYDFRNTALRLELADRLHRITRHMAHADAGRITWEKAVERIFAIMPDDQLPDWAVRRKLEKAA